MRPFALMVLFLFHLMSSAAAAQSVAFAIPSENGFSIMFSDGELLQLGKDCTVSREGGGTGNWWNVSSAIAAKVDGRTYLVSRELKGLPSCADPNLATVEQEKEAEPLVTQQVAPCDNAALLEDSLVSVEKRLWEKYGLRYAIRKSIDPSNPIRQVGYISHVRSGSHAHEAGIQPCDVLFFFGTGVTHPGLNRKTVEDLSRDLLKELRRKNTIIGEALPLSLALKYFSDSGNLYPSESDAKYASGKTVNAGLYRQSMRRFFMPDDLIADHLGVVLESGNAVAQVMSNSPASVAGLEIGDRIEGISGLWNRGARSTWRTYQNLYEYAALRNEVTRLTVLRRGQKITLQMPPRAPGADFVYGNVPPRVSAALDELPQALEGIFRSLYLGDYVRVEKFKKAFINRYYTGSQQALVLSLLPDVERAVEDSLEASRLEGAIAQYALVRTSTLGLCAEQASFFTLTEKMVETIRNRFGVTLSERIVSEDRRSFLVPRKFASAVETAQASKQFAPWAEGIARFVEKLGGCNSAEMAQLEANMLAYMRY